MNNRIPLGSRVLFTGDSITDCGRRDDADGLGDGYVRRVASALESLNVEVTNTGVGGDRVRDLKRRWAHDVREQDADVVSVMIGINDTWRRFSSADPTSTEDFEADYRCLLADAGLAGRQLVLVEPFVIPVDEGQTQWAVDLDAKRAVVHRLAREFDAVLVETHDSLNDLTAKLGARALVADGVHPTALGHHKLAELWLDAVLN